MSQPLAPDLEAKAQELAMRLQDKSHATLLDIARTLVATPDEQLFGETEFVIRDKVMQTMALAYTEHLEKKEATKVPPSTAHNAGPTLSSMTTESKPSSDSAARFPSTGPITIADVADREAAPGTESSD